MARKRWNKKSKPLDSFKPYKNQFEFKIAKAMPGADYEDKSRVVVYQTESKYNVDFTFSGIPWLLIEAKGRFMGRAKEAAKYVWVKRSHPDLEFIFIFGNRNAKVYSGVRQRKDGTFLTMGGWAAKNKFVSFDVRSLPPWLVSGKITKEIFFKTLQKQRAEYGLKKLHQED